MKRLLAFGLSLGLVAALAVPAMANVERNQIITNSYYITVNAADDGTGGVNPRTIIVTFNPCDGTFEFSYGGGFVEEIVDTSEVKDSMVYLDMKQPSGYFWGGVFPLDGGYTTHVYDRSGGVKSLFADLTRTSTDYKNHGEYVKEMGGGADAARYCIGMPVQAQS